MNEKNQQVSDEQIDALIRSGLWQDEQPLTADEEKLADAAFARAMAKIDRKAKRQKRRTVLHMLDRVVRVAACLIVAVGIAFPIALANSEAFREQILQLVLSRSWNKRHRKALPASGGKCFLLYMGCERFYLRRSPSRAILSSDSCRTA